MKMKAIVLLLLLLAPSVWAQDEGPPPAEPEAQEGQDGPPVEEDLPPLPPLRRREEPANNRQVLDEVVARVNNRIITRSELLDANEALRRELAQEMSGEALESAYAEQVQDNLRGLIDVQLLVQYGKDRGYSVESDVLTRLDAIRQDMGLDSMEALERAMLSEGVSIEDYKERLREQLMYNLVIQRDVARSVFLDDESVEKYYEEHKEEFVKPEAVRLREILISTAVRSREEAAERTREVLRRVRTGGDFAELAEEYSDSSTAERGGELGIFDPSTLSQEIQGLVSPLLEGGVADPQLTPEGYLLLQLVERSVAGIPEMENVRGEIMNVLYQEKMAPAFREFLNRMRDENYVYVKVGYTDTGAIPEEKKPILRGRERRKARSAN